MRSDIEGLLGSLDPKDAKILQKSAWRKCLEEIPPDDTVLAAIPVVFNKSRGPLVITSTQLMYISDMGDRLSTPLSDVHGSRYEELGMFKRKPFQLHINIGHDEVSFDLPRTQPASISYFVEQLKTALDARQPSAKTHSEADELAKFADLRDRGIISTEEFEEKKGELLT